MFTSILRAPRTQLALALLALSTGHVFAASDSWKSDASGNWTDTTKWLSGTQYPNGAGNIATFGYNITAPRTVTLTSAITVGSMVFNDTDGTGQSGNLSSSGYKISLGNYNLTLDNPEKENGKLARAQQVT